MAISKEAQQNHDALFGDRRSTLMQTDPELVEVFDNWAFEEVIAESVLDARTRLVVQLAAIIACHGVNEYSVMLRWGSMAKSQESATGACSIHIATRRPS